MIHGHIELIDSFKTDHSRIMFGSFAYIASRILLAVAGGEGFIEIWDINKRRRILKFKGHDGDIFKLIYIEEKEMLLSAANDHMVRVWDTKNNFKLFTSFTKHTGPVFALEYLPDLNMIASGGEDEHIRFWKIENSNEDVSSILTKETKVGSLCYMAKIGKIAVGFDNGNIHLIQINNKTIQLKETKRAHLAYILNLAFIEEKDWLISASDDGSIKIWRVEERKFDLLKEIREPGTMVRTFGVFFEQDLLVSNHDDKQLRIWKLSTGEFIRNYKDEDFGEGLIILKNKNQIATGIHHNVKLWKIK